MSRTVLITGAAGALGTVVSQVFAAHGWDLILFDVSDERLKLNFPMANTQAVDLTNFEAVKEAVFALPQTPDAVLNIAGGFSMQVAEEAVPEDLQHLMSINFNTLFNTVTAVLPRMLARKTGFIAGISAGAGIQGAGGMALYSAAKAAVRVYLRSLAQELGHAGIRVSTVFPMGAIDTPGNRVAMPRIDPNTWIDPYRIAEALHFLAVSDVRGHIQELQIEVAQ